MFGDVLPKVSFKVGAILKMAMGVEFNEKGVHIR
jgi:hypothetical protein